MKITKVFLICLSLLCMLSLAQNSGQNNYVFFLHNKYLEDNEINEAHPKYGITEYYHVLEKLRTEHTIVISEKRKKNTDAKLYAKKIIFQIDSLHKKGIPFENISIVGTSQGGYITQYISYFSKNPKLKFVIIGASFKNDSMNKDKDFKLYGKILSITEKSDTDSELLSKQKRFINSRIESFKELVINTDLNHGFLFRAIDDWILPTNNWIRSK